MVHSLVSVSCFSEHHLEDLEVAVQDKLENVAVANALQLEAARHRARPFPL